MAFPTNLPGLLGLLGVASACVAIGCAGASAGGSKYKVYPPSDVSGETASCEKLCNLEVSAETVEAFCDALVAKAKDRIGEATCKPQGPLGLPTRDEAAVRDAMLVDLVVAGEGEARWSVLALRTEKGWELATELGAVRGAAIERSDAVQVVGARAVDAPGLAPYGVEVRVRIDAQGSTVDKVFVCGKQGKGVACPKAIVAAS